MNNRLEPIQQPIILPPEQPKPVSPLWFVLLAVVLIACAAVAGLLHSGKISLDKILGRKPAVAHAASTPAPLKAGAFVVTSISVGRPSYAIINGVSHAEGDTLSAPGATGWRVRRIDDAVVWVQNGMTVTSIPLTTMALKPLNDTLHPLN
ncbi:MAG TPA: hypothetical protein VHY22_02450 [Chthoniobacteraceae bacterium]|jgi:hypothetical protein|nr:hypothetical protein [Chthoniobacteraceae bacterium]